MPNAQIISDNFIHLENICDILFIFKEKAVDIMFNFPPLFIAEEENNLTLPPMRSFAATNNISLKGLSERRDIVDAIQSYANMSDDNCEKVQCWFDDIVTEGIKELHVRRVDLDPQDIVRLKDSVNYQKSLMICLSMPAIGITLEIDTQVH